MEHFIKEIKINQLRHLSNITIPLNQNQRQHLLITGKNGSGKTSLLMEISHYIHDLYTGIIIEEEGNPKRAISLSMHGRREIIKLHANGDFVSALFPAQRQVKFIKSKGAENVVLQKTYDFDDDPSKLLLKYMVHLKTQQSYARNEGDTENVERIEQWFDRFEKALQILFDDDMLKLEYYYKNYDFRIHEQGRLPFGLDELSDGYSSVIYIVSNLIMRMDRNWLLGDSISSYDVEGIVLIDELETHLHIDLQKKILPFLTEFFPRVQFIVTTHSPYILNSISNAKAYDLEHCIELEGLSMYSAEGLAEGYFEMDEYSEVLKDKLARYRVLTEKTNPSQSEKAERAELRCELKAIPAGLSPDARDEFEEIERMRNGKN